MSLVRSDCLVAAGIAAVMLACDAGPLASAQAFRGGSGEVKREDQVDHLGEQLASGYGEKVLFQEDYPRMPLNLLNLISSGAKPRRGDHSHMRGR